VSVEVVVFGRAPVAGRVKTRLAREIGPEGAAAVYRLLLEAALAEAIDSGLPVSLDVAEPLDDCWSPPPGITVGLQAEGDLGQRMAAAFARRFAAGAKGVVLVGSDSPSITAGHFLLAARLCRQARVVLGPARDGGYWLVAQQRPGVAMFDGVPWSSPRTLEVTRALLERLRVTCVDLDTLRDVDTLEDLRDVIADDAVGPKLRRSLAGIVGAARLL
jgi:rSAM/selenodomain-associated transferase 1